MNRDPPRLRHFTIDRAKRDLPSADRLAKIASGLSLGPTGGGSGGGSGGGGAAAPVKAVSAWLSPTVSGALLGGVLGLATLGALAIASTPRADAPTTANTASPQNAGPGVRSDAIVPSAANTGRASAQSSPESRTPRTKNAASSAESIESMPPDVASDDSAASPDLAHPSESEAKLLKRAQTALASDPSLALRFCEEHAERFPSGLLGQEREMIAITALLAQGNKPAARARGARLVASFPGSAYRRRLEVLFNDLEKEDVDHKNSDVPSSIP